MLLHRRSGGIETSGSSLRIERSRFLFAKAKARFGFTYPQTYPQRVGKSCDFVDNLSTDKEKFMRGRC